LYEDSENVGLFRIKLRAIAVGNSIDILDERADRTETTAVVGMLGKGPLKFI
jgi:hypothetical protein